MKQSIKNQPKPAEQITIAEITIDQVSLEPIREFFKQTGPEKIVEDLDNVIDLVFEQIKNDYTVDFIYELCYSLHMLRKAIKEVDKQLTREGGVICQ
ncbi:hypothetical protein GXP67_21105 [Rhodocytophaga rosea]|uniref:Uncharacterized protein n=1 Tax=Rhodocytophaga rosea TaxID=2704465 RepID=A0A6C0GLU5_9BACT|nr:hypothetical protein [Rhodocytophaga rosea]QHT68969.1 hypothetical protein GXP67_21105 [Rhodocytophaga rosea]